MDAWLRVDRLDAADTPSSNQHPYSLRVILNREATEREAKAFNVAWDELASPELHEPGHAEMNGNTITFVQTSREEFFLRHRARLNKVLLDIERTETS